MIGFAQGGFSCHANPRIGASKVAHANEPLKGWAEASQTQQERQTNLCTCINMLDHTKKRTSKQLHRGCRRGGGGGGGGGVAMELQIGNEFDSRHQEGACRRT
jgi:hypothetical protein